MQMYWVDDETVQSQTMEVGPSFAQIAGEEGGGLRCQAIYLECRFDFLWLRRLDYHSSLWSCISADLLLTSLTYPKTSFHCTSAIDGNKAAID